MLALLGYATLRVPGGKEAGPVMVRPPLMVTTAISVTVMVSGSLTSTSWTSVALSFTVTVSGSLMKMGPEEALLMVSV